ncbi:MAG: hypothetical protein Alpg2KO_01040 [Alphaproteobacteria bacterium]
MAEIRVNYTEADLNFFERALNAIDTVEDLDGSYSSSRIRGSVTVLGRRVEVELRGDFDINEQAGTAAGTLDDVFIRLDGRTLLSATELDLDVERIIDAVIYGDEVEDLIEEVAQDTDLYIGSDAADEMFGHAGDDRIFGGEGADVIEGGLGRDNIKGQLGNDRIDGGADKDRLFGHAGDDHLTGGLGNDRLKGGDGDDVLVDGHGKDQLFGNDGDDSLTGGAGRDRLSGGEGADRFIWTAITDSLKANRKADRVTDFDADDGDLLDLTALNFSDGAFIAGSKFSGDGGGEVRHAGAYLRLDVDGDGKADMSIRIGAAEVEAQDFLF